MIDLIDDDANGNKIPIINEYVWEQKHFNLSFIFQNMDMLWQDYITKLHDQVQEPLTKYQGHIPQIKVGCNLVAMKWNKSGDS